MERKRFPQYLNSPLQVLWLESDEFSIFLGCLVLAMTYGWQFFILMFVIPWAYSKAKRKYPRGFFKHCLWFAGLVKIEGYPEYFEKRFNE